jgi:hypothetical protein
LIFPFKRILFLTAFVPVVNAETNTCQGTSVKEVDRLADASPEVIELIKKIERNETVENPQYKVKSFAYDEKT